MTDVKDISLQSEPHMEEQSDCIEAGRFFRVRVGKFHEFIELIGHGINIFLSVCIYGSQHVEEQWENVNATDQ